MKDTPYSSEQLKQRNLDELYGLLAQLKRELLDLRIMLATSQIKQTHKIKETRKNIARVLTEINARVNETKGKRRKHHG